MKITSEIKGIEKAQKKLKILPSTAIQAMKRFLVKESEGIMAQSKDLVPVDEGNLRASGHVQPPKVNRNSVSIEMGYGGPAVDYAVIVHEDLTAHHTVGMAKYLEVPFNQAKRGQRKRAADELEKEVRKEVKK